MAEKMTEKNVKRYLELSKPFENEEAANVAIKRFYEMVGAARQECGLADVAVILMDGIENGDDVGQFINTMHWGNSLNAEGMTAYAYGQAQSERKAAIESLAGQGAKRAKP